jgi:hypothetical protein
MKGSWLVTFFWPNPGLVDNNHYGECPGSTPPPRGRQRAKRSTCLWSGDFNHFDDAVALMLVAKAPRSRPELIVVEYSFNTGSRVGLSDSTPFPSGYRVFMLKYASQM